MRFSTTIAVVLFSFLSLNIQSQNFQESDYGALEYRLLGPFRGGRSAAVTGVTNQPNSLLFWSSWRWYMENH